MQHRDKESPPFCPHLIKSWSCRTAVKQAIFLIIFLLFLFQLLFQTTTEGKKGENTRKPIDSKSSPESIKMSVSEGEVSDPPHNAISTWTTKNSTMQLNLKEGDNDSKQRSLKKNFMFVKTHKCGTSTLVDVFYLLGVRRRLNFVLDPHEHKLYLNTDR